MISDERAHRRYVVALGRAAERQRRASEAANRAAEERHREVNLRHRAAVEALQRRHHHERLRAAM